MTREPLVATRDRPSGAVTLRSPSGRTFPVRDGIAVFIDEAPLAAAALQQQRVFDRLAPFYDLLSLVHRVVSPQARRWREDYLQELMVRPGSRVLEVSIGTGANLRRLPPGEYFGLDISWRMLRRCLRKQRRSIRLTLCQGLADQLPFPDNAFDVVFHVGAINFFPDQARALAEMVRVARPSTRVTIVDVNESFARRHRRTPILSLYSRAGVHRPPLAFVPAGVEAVRLKDIADGQLYCLTFEKPAAALAHPPAAGV